MNEDKDQDLTIVKLQSDQFIIGSISHTTKIAGDSRHYEVDLARQSCQCRDFEDHRNSFPIGDPRRFCCHLVTARCEHLDDLPPFLQSLLEAHDAAQAGLPNGASFAFFEIDGRLAFYSENRDQTAYFFLTGISGTVFHEYIYDRKRKKWLNGKTPDSPDRLLVFAFKERGKFVRPKKSRAIDGRARRRRRSKPPENRETSTPVKYLFLLLVAAGLITLGYYIFKGPYERWVAAANADDQEEVQIPPDGNKIPDNKQKRKTPQELAQEALDDANLPDVDDEPPEDEESDPNPNPDETTSENETETQEPALPEPEFREWKTSDDKFSVVAKYKYFQNGKVVIERQDNGKTIKVDEYLLRPEDQEYVDNIRMERRLQNARNRRNQENDDGDDQ